MSYNKNYDMCVFPFNYINNKTKIFTFNKINFGNLYTDLYFYNTKYQ